MIITMTDEQFHQNHIALWMWLAETGSEKKGSFPGWTTLRRYKEYCDSSIDEALITQCFACGCAVSRDSTSKCSDCPVDWGGLTRLTACTEYHSPYIRWYLSKKVEERKELALRIASLPWR